MSSSDQISPVTPLPEANAVPVATPPPVPGTDVVATTGGRFSAKQPILMDEQDEIIWLSKRETFLAEAFLETRNYYRAAGMLRTKYPGTKTTDCVAKNWLNKPHIQNYLTKRVRQLGICNGMTKERWISEAIQFRDGTKQANSVTVMMHTLIGKALGYLLENKNNFSAENMQINFTQADGRS